MSSPSRSPPSSHAGARAKTKGLAPRPSANAPLTWAETVEPILQQRCQNCHRDGGIAPFPLMTYEDFKGVAEAAKIKITSREMPPWGAFDDEACKHRFGFKDDLRMKDEEIQKVVAWMDAGMPQGDMAKRPAPKTFGATNLVGKTHTLQMAAPHEVREGTSDDIRCFPVDPGFTQDTWVGGVNLIPGDPRVVHHVIVFTDPERQSVAKAAAGGGSYPCFGGPGITNTALLLAWAPGVPPTTYGEDVGIKVLKGSNLVMQVHYHAYEKTTSDQTSFELKALPTKPSFVAQILLAGNASGPNGFMKLLPGPNDPPSGPAFVIPSNVKDHTESMELTIPKTVQGVDIPTSSVYAIGSHMHLTGVDMKIQIERAAPSDDQPAKECLLGTPKYDFNWQRGYEYDAQLDKLPTVAGGDTLRFTCKYDNTMGNRNVAKALKEKNMSVPPEVRLGEETLDEMCLGAIVLVRRVTAIDN